MFRAVEKRGGSFTRKTVQSLKSGLEESEKKQVTELHTKKKLIHYQLLEKCCGKSGLKRTRGEQNKNKLIQRVPKCVGKSGNKPKQYGARTRWWFGRNQAENP